LIVERRQRKYFNIVDNLCHAIQVFYAALRRGVREFLVAWQSFLKPATDKQAPNAQLAYSELATSKSLGSRTTTAQFSRRAGLGVMIVDSSCKGSTQ
jgi:hypothetical protein